MKGRVCYRLDYSSIDRLERSSRALAAAEEDAAFRALSLLREAAADCGEHDYPRTWKDPETALHSVRSILAGSVPFGETLAEDVLTALSWPSDGEPWPLPRGMRYERGIVHAESSGRVGVAIDKRGRVTPEGA